ncbi:MAG TPA: hypothetical protein VHZ78_03415 [Rhizomicrobium sp.]|jgi:hypothetical protein|nr:hypothetical protein [Rhizomicrobium sp.]
MSTGSSLQTSLRLSALRAFLGRIHPGMRLIKIKAVDHEIVVSIIMDEEPSEAVREDVSDAATEIIADFSAPFVVREHFEVSTRPLSREDIFSEGWIFARAEQ